MNQQLRSALEVEVEVELEDESEGAVPEEQLKI